MALIDRLNSLGICTTPEGDPEIVDRYWEMCLWCSSVHTVKSS